MCVCVCERERERERERQTDRQRQQERQKERKKDLIYSALVYVGLQKKGGPMPIRKCLRPSSQPVFYLPKHS